MRVAVSFSGGKDSTYATWLVQHQGWEIAALLTVRPHLTDSFMFHHPNVEWTRLQSQAMGVAHEMVEAVGKDELATLGDRLDRLKSLQGISGLVTGAVTSDYQKTRFDNMCAGIGLRSYSPLWRKSPRILVDNLKQVGFKIILTAVAAKGLDDSWLGRELSDQDWVKLERISWAHGINLTGEGGEYESFVVDAPHFTKRIEIEKSRTEWDGDAGRMEIESASLRDKSGD